MKEIIARFCDWRHERHITRMGRRCLQAQKEGRLLDARMWWEAHRRAILGRSPEQVARMERRMGLR